MARPNVRIVDVHVRPRPPPRGHAGRASSPRSSRRWPSGRGTASVASSAETPPARQEQRGRAGRVAQLGGHPPAELAHLLPCGAHQGDGRIVHVEARGPSKRSGTVSRGPKLTMSRAPRPTTCGSPAGRRAVSRSGPADQHATDQVVGQLGGGEVEHAGQQSADRRGLRAPGRRTRWRGRPVPRSRARPAARARASTAGVVTPNIDAAISGRSSSPELRNRRARRPPCRPPRRRRCRASPGTPG